MNTLPLFYKQLVSLNEKVHGDLYIESADGFQYADNTNSVYIAAVEFARAAREYPIVFARDADQLIFPVVLLGLKQNQNLFLDKKGKWLAEYIPAYVRRYPFILARSGGDQDEFTVCIDESFPGFNTAKKGKPLFDEKGDHQTVLQQVVDFLRDYQNQIRLTNLFCEAVNELDILEPMQANIKLNSGKKHITGSFLGINRDKLKALKPAACARLVRSEHMELIYAHLASLGNLGALINKFNGQGAVDEAFAGDPEE